MWPAGWLPCRCCGQTGQVAACCERHSGMERSQGAQGCKNSVSAGLPQLCHSRSPEQSPPRTNPQAGPPALSKGSLSPPSTHLALYHPPTPLPHPSPRFPTLSPHPSHPLILLSSHSSFFPSPHPSTPLPPFQPSLPSCEVRFVFQPQPCCRFPRKEHTIKTRT